MSANLEKAQKERAEKRAKEEAERQAKEEEEAKKRLEEEKTKLRNMEEEQNGEVVEEEMDISDNIVSHRSRWAGLEIPIYLLARCDSELQNGN